MGCITGSSGTTFEGMAYWNTGGYGEMTDAVSGDYARIYQPGVYSDVSVNITAAASAPITSCLFFKASVMPTPLVSDTLLATESQNFYKRLIISPSACAA